MSHFIKFQHALEFSDVRGLDTFVKGQNFSTESNSTGKKLSIESSTEKVKPVVVAKKVEFESEFLSKITEFLEIWDHQFSEASNNAAVFYGLGLLHFEDF